ncbi:PAS domain-containing protein [Pelagovum pacificum]|uniref:PAS domain-containing protein n=1 Tax=Pelagovum pacificum TaxID=2588711 RepID=A0A5C5GG60_9RHOB|nr:PAS domain-containing protein [Pelagovum pacificum]QQA43919.1 PAS domain-containing protein [Pelagovum pacificum]TNY32951.1 PAS domain-containing protein [Pelagovum pacificum]
MTSNADALPEALRSYFDRSTVALALSDTSDDVPLVLVNDKFCELTGYEPDDVIGHNCRMLQGEETSSDDRAGLREFLEDDSQEGGRFPILNYRKSGEAFYNLVFMTRLRDDQGVTRFILASQFDMTTTKLRARLDDNDARLNRSLSDVETIGREFGLAMQGSAKILSDSVAMLARLSMDGYR